MEISGFTLNLDLTLYFEDLRKFSSIYVDNTKCKEVGDVENHVKNMFKLEDNICLMNNKYLIPRSESINILQQNKTLKVQKCDFYDYQIHKNKRFNPPCDNPALNLVQSDRTIDLSCRPKQRLKINICQNNCVLESPKTDFENARPRYTTQPPEVSYENSDIETKYKPKSKKKKYDIQKEEEVDNEESTTNILDMSVNKVKKKNKVGFLTNDKQQIIEDSNVDYQSQIEDNQESSYQYRKKSKKRKKTLDIEEIDLANSCWENIVADKGSDKKRKNKTKHLNDECSDNIAKDLSLSLSGNLEIDDKESSLNSCQEEIVTRKKQKSERPVEMKNQNVNHKKMNRDYRNDKDDLQSADIINTNGSSMAEINNTQTMSNGFPRLALHEGESQRSNVVKGDILLLQTNSEICSSNAMEVQESILHNLSNITNDSQDDSEFHKLNGDLSNSEVKGLECFEDFSNIKVKRKRIRKHNKKRKRERLEYLSAVGPMLNRIMEPPKEEIKPVSLGQAKHLFFTEDDLIEEIPESTSPSGKSLSAFKGDQEIENQNLSQNDKSSNTSTTTDTNWQFNLMNLSSVSAKPPVFHRNTQPAIQVKNDLPYNSSKNSTALDTRTGRLQNNTAIIGCKNNVSQEFSSVSKEVPTCNGGKTGSSCIKEDLSSTAKTSSVNRSDSNINLLRRSIDLKNIVLAKYPVIDKIVPEDLILFKVHKLSENNEPFCSNIILGKVTNETHFPEKISLQILDGFEECNHFTVAENGDNPTIELQWANIVEPRLFYP